jgi:hypothetical protein
MNDEDKAVLFARVMRNAHILTRMHVVALDKATTGESMSEEEMNWCFTAFLTRLDSLCGETGAGLGLSLGEMEKIFNGVQEGAEGLNKMADMLTNPFGDAKENMQ